MKTNKMLIVVVMICSGSFFSCEKEQGNEQLYQTWVLIEKVKYNIKETMPLDGYPITLTFYATNDFEGRHDANLYKGTYKLFQDSISFSFMDITDVADIDWYLNYLLELNQVNKMLLIDSNNMRLSNSMDSMTLHFVSKRLFEETQFKLKE
jgi:hypothetical protein